MPPKLKAPAGPAANVRDEADEMPPPAPLPATYRPPKRVSDFEISVGERYIAVRNAVPDAGRFALLHLGSECAGLAVGAGTVPDTVLLLPVGWRRTVRECFRRQPPDAKDLERAIEKVEDEVMKARSLLREPVVLYTTDVVLQEVVRVASAGATAVARLPVEVVESLFNRLADLASGRPATQDSLPPEPEFAAALLILRELLQHTGQPAIEVLN
jgi:exopolyphosphatase/pppGpp-phosphohydrolase